MRGASLYWEKRKLQNVSRTCKNENQKICYFPSILFKVKIYLSKYFIKKILRIIKLMAKHIGAKFLKK